MRHIPLAVGYFAGLYTALELQSLAALAVVVIVAASAFLYELPEPRRNA